jgi:hypothetical protein
MLRYVLGFTAIVLFTTGLAAGCGGEISGADSGAGCTVPGGTYVEHFVAQTPVQCVAISDVTYTLNGATTFAVSDAGPGAPSPGCTASVDGPTCTVSYVCTQTTSSSTVQANMSLVYKSDGTATGTLTETTTSGTTTTICKYDVTVSKK